MSAKEKARKYVAVGCGFAVFAAVVVVGAFSAYLAASIGGWVSVAFWLIALGAFGNAALWVPHLIRAAKREAKS